MARENKVVKSTSLIGVDKNPYKVNGITEKRQERLKLSFIKDKGPPAECTEYISFKVAIPVLKKQPV